MRPYKAWRTVPSEMSAGVQSTLVQTPLARVDALWPPKQQQYHATVLHPGHMRA